MTRKQESQGSIYSTTEKTSIIAGLSDIVILEKMFEVASHTRPLGVEMVRTHGDFCTLIDSLNARWEHGENHNLFIAIVACCQMMLSDTPKIFRRQKN